MSKCIVFTMLVLIATSSFGQQIKPEPLTPDYLKKSKNQKTAAWLLFSAGFTTSVITAATNAGVCVGPGCKKKSFPVVPVAIGGAAIASSIPLFIASARNKRKAINPSAFFKMQGNPALSTTGLRFKLIPSLSIKLNL